MFEVIAARDGLDKTIQYAIDGRCTPGIFQLISIPTIIACIGALIIIIAAIVTPFVRSQHRNLVLYYVWLCGIENFDDGDCKDSPMLIYSKKVWKKGPEKT